MKKIGIIGSRRRDSYRDFLQCEKAFLKVYEAGDEIVSGGCPKGGDRFAEVLAKKHQIPIKIYYAQWNELGKRAGFARNGDIAKDSNVLISVVSPDRTGGAEDTVKKAMKAKDQKTIIILEEEEDTSKPEDFDPLDL